MLKRVLSTEESEHKLDSESSESGHGAVRVAGVDLWLAAVGEKSLRDSGEQVGGARAARSGRQSCAALSRESRSSPEARSRWYGKGCRRRGGQVATARVLDGVPLPGFGSQICQSLTERPQSSCITSVDLSQLVG